MSTPSGDRHSSNAGTASGEAVDAMQQALAAEHAAVWSYQLATAYVAAGTANAVDTGSTNHRAQRDTCTRIVHQAGEHPVDAKAGYRTPKPVRDADSAMRLLAVAERDCCSAWRGVLERTDDADLRNTALQALTYSAVRATHWRKLTGQIPSAAALPGS